MSRRFGFLLVIAVFVMGLAVAYYAWRSERLAAETEFRSITSDSTETIIRQIDGYAQLLNSMAAYIGVTENVPLFDYNEYVSSLELDKHYPAIRGLVFVRSVSSYGAPFLEKGIESEYQRNVVIRPASDLDERFILSRIAPLDGNFSALGMDLAVKPKRRATLVSAREMRETKLSPRITLVQDARKLPGFFLARAIYEKVFDAQSSSAVEGDFLGWIGTPFVADELLRNVTFSLGENFNLEVFDGPELTEADRIFDSGLTEVNRGSFVRSYPIDLYGQVWFLRFTSTPGFDATVLSFFPLALMIVGLMLTALLRMALKYNDLRSMALEQESDLKSRQLGAREDENRALVDTTMAAVLVLDETGRIQLANAGAAELFNREVSTFVGEDFADFVVLKPGQQAIDGYNAEGICRDGKRLFLDVETNKWTDADGSERVTALVRNVTTMIEARKEIDEVRKRYDVALAGAEIGIFEIDLTTGHSIVSDTWHKIMGTDTLNEPFDHQRHFLARVHKEDLPGLLKADQSCINGETDRTEAEYRVKFGDEWRWMFSDAIAVERGADGRARRLIGTQCDITAERHARNALELSEARFRMVLEDAPVGMALMDEKGQFIGANRALSKLCGYSGHLLLSRMKMSELLVEEDYLMMTSEVGALLEKGQRNTYETEARIITSAGEVRWGLFNVSWTQDKNRGQYVYIAQVVDVTDQKKLEQIKSEFVATVSHELRTPLTSIKGALGLLGTMEADRMSSGAGRLLEIARVNADRLTTIVNDILDLEKISSGEVVFDLENHPLREVIEASMAEMQPFACEHASTLVLEAPEEELMAHIDAARTKQVLANLISNACKYSDADSDVVVSYERIGEEIIVFVRNTGPGVPTSFRDKIFDAFTQADGSDTRSKGGTGLGLNITRQIVVRQSGQIGFESVAGGLTVFWFTLPMVESDAMVRHEDQPREIAPASHALKVLHIEDDVDFSDVIRAGLGDAADFRTAASLKQAREAIINKRWDVIVMDWTLPDGDGRVLINKIRSMYPKTRLIVLTAATGEEDPRVHATLIKSQVEIDEIVSLIRDHVPEEETEIRKTFI